MGVDSDPVQKWLKALRSGKYEQTKGWLNKEGAYCCLGVACEVYNENNDPLATETYTEYDPGISSPSFKVTSYGDGASTELPPEVMMWLGLADEGGSYSVPCKEEPDYTESRSLVLDNDDCKMTFEQIADVIESNPERLFNER